MNNQLNKKSSNNTQGTKNNVKFAPIVNKNGEIVQSTPIKAKFPNNKSAPIESGQSKSSQPSGNITDQIDQCGGVNHSFTYSRKKQEFQNELNTCCKKFKIMVWFCIYLILQTNRLSNCVQNPLPGQLNFKQTMVLSTKVSKASMKQIKATMLTGYPVG